ncbi:MAG: MBL fold metallo-hydrolase [Deltaproteobacteria bacterium]|nr:MBL fold metallo-hydrolase [Deltaproteobacteria bacterium]
MKIINLTEPGGSIYTCNVYMVLGDWNALEDTNSLVDVGRDPAIIQRLKDINTGVGKRQVEQVILTHSHFDHVGLLSEIRKTFSPTVYAFSRFEGVDLLLKDGDIVRLGDVNFEVIHTPGHSHDSICLCSEQGGILFSGDSPVNISAQDTYGEDFVNALRRISRKNITAIYPGHDEPITDRAGEILRASIKNVIEGKAKGGKKGAGY